LVVATCRYLVEDVARAVDTYTTRLDFELVTAMGDAFAMVKRDDLTLWLSGPKSSAARAMADGTSPEPGGWNRIVFEVDDIDNEVLRLGDLGVTFRNAVVRGPGGAQVLMEDGEGNLIELFEPAR
jgi:catechol 2,3-dioxygenase-like lactoylglutathione lyase family enzyme